MRSHLLECPQAAAAPGHVLLFRLRGYPARHLAVLLTGGDMAHAVKGRGVVRSRFGHWRRRRLVGVFAFPQARKDRRHDGSDHINTQYGQQFLNSDLGRLV